MSLKMTVLDMVQDIMSAMDDDEINSIDDSVSALQVATVIRACFFELVTELDLPGQQALVQLEALADVDRPNYLKMPDSIRKIEWIKYDENDLSYLSPQEFYKRSLTLTENIVVVEDFNGVSINVSNDGPPTYWTTFDDTYLVFDSFNLTDESTLTSGRSVAFVFTEPDFEIDDDFVPPLTPALFPILLAKAKNRCFVNFKQVANSLEAQTERRGLVRHQNDMWRNGQRNPINRTPDYGRPRR